MSRELPIKGPLGYWTFPVLNAIVLASRESDDISSPEGKTVEIAKVIRDDSGNIEEVEVTEVE